MNKKFFLIFCGAPLVATCGSLPSENTAPELSDIPAFIPESSAVSQQIITEAVVSLTQNSRVALGDSVFAENDALIVHRAQLTGRDLGTVEHFRLVLRGEDCFLVHQNSGNYLQLPDLDCAPYSESLVEPNQP